MTVKFIFLRGTKAVECGTMRYNDTEIHAFTGDNPKGSNSIIYLFEKQ